jgi:hypothetical protein
MTTSLITLKTRIGIAIKAGSTARAGQVIYNFYSIIRTVCKMSIRVAVEASLATTLVSRQISKKRHL